MQKIAGIDAELVMLFARITSCVARRRQYQSHYGTLDFNRPAVEGILPPPIADAREHKVATEALIDCVRGVTEDLARWHTRWLETTTDDRSRARSDVYWHACRVLLFRHVYRRDVHDEECRQSAMAVIHLCDGLTDGKIEYLNWVSVTTPAKSLLIYVQPLVIASSILEKSQSDARTLVTRVFQKFSFQRCFDLSGSRGIVEEMWKRIDSGRDYDACFWVEVMWETGQSFLVG
jgi:hypothetical protein